MWIVYLIQNTNSNEIYIGVTENLQERIRTHNAGGKKFTTRRQGKWIPIYVEAYRSKEDAEEREQKLKHHGSAKHELIKRIHRSLIPKLGLDAAKVPLATV